MPASPDQQQQIIQQLGERSPEFAATPLDFQQQVVDAMTGSASPQQAMSKMVALQKQYPDLIKNESIWKNKAFIAGLAALSGGIASQVIPALMGGGAGATTAAESILPGTESAEAAAASGAGMAADAAAGGAATGAEMGLDDAGEAIADTGVDAGADAGADAADGILPGDEFPDNGLPGQEFPGGQTPSLPGGSILDKVKSASDKLGPILSNMSANGQKANQTRDQLMPSAENAKLARDKFALDAPTTRMNQSVRASILNTMTPTQVQWGGPGSGLKGQIPTFTGSFTGAIQNMDPRTKQLADTVMTKDLQDQLAGKDDETKFLDQIGKESALDKVVGGASAGANIFNALKGIFF